MEGSNFIAELRNVRSMLRDSVSSAAQMENKLLGPRPSEGAQAKQPSESVVTLIGEISAMSAQLHKMLCHHHEIIGEFGGEAVATQSRYA